MTYNELVCVIFYCSTMVTFSSSSEMSCQLKLMFAQDAMNSFYLDSHYLPTGKYLYNINTLYQTYVCKRLG